MRGDRLTCNRKTLGGGAAAVILLLVAVAPAFACSGNRGTLTARPARADAGATIDLNGSSFQTASDLLINVRWGGPSGLLLVQVAPDETGSFTTQITVPAGAETGFHQISATQRQPDNTFFSATVAIEVQGAPAPVPTPVPAASQPSEPSPTPASVAQATAPASQAAPTSQATPTAQASPVTRGPAASQAESAPAVAARSASAAAPAQAPPPAAAPPVPPTPVTPAGPAAVNPVPAGTAIPGSAEATPIPALPERDASVMGGPRTVAIESGPALWLLVPLIVTGLTLFAASCAAIVSDVRQRRVEAKVEA